MVAISGSTSSYAPINAFFQKFDVNGDNGLSLDEFKAIGADKDGKKVADDSQLESLFSAIDADGDGSVSSSELTSFAEANFKDRMAKGGNLSGANLIQASSPQEFAANFISKADTDGDGAISLDEFKAAKPKDAPADTADDDKSAKIFAALDKDGDGKLTSDELAAGKAGDASGVAGGAGKAHHGGGGHGAKAADDDDDDDTSSNTTIDPLDTNGDGIVSLAELMAGTKSSAANAIQSLGQTLSVLLSAQEESSAAA